MISGFLLAAHGAAAVFAFFRYRKESSSDGFLAVAFFVLMFSVGWTISTMVTSPLLNADAVSQWYQKPAESDFSGIAKRELNRDTIALLLVTACESVFYYFYLRTEKKSEGGKSTAA
jgi:hypothetical protein